jgi:hypothetical protein
MSEEQQQPSGEEKAYDWTEDFTLAQLKLVQFYQAFIHGKPNSDELLREAHRHINNVIVATEYPL